mgnify:CR=1 FL=1
MPRGTNKNQKFYYFPTVYLFTIIGLDQPPFFYSWSKITHFRHILLTKAIGRKSMISRILEIFKIFQMLQRFKIYFVVCVIVISWSRTVSDLQDQFLAFSNDQNQFKTNSIAFTDQIKSILENPLDLKLLTTGYYSLKKKLLLWGTTTF